MLLSDELLTEGYEAAATSDGAAAIDGLIACEMPCEKCGNLCEYRPRTKSSVVGIRIYRSYRAFSTCIHCQNEIEF